MRTQGHGQPRAAATTWESPSGPVALLVLFFVTIPRRSHGNMVGEAEAAPLDEPCQ
jgi:hypothetical protein